MTRRTPALLALTALALAAFPAAASAQRAVTAVGEAKVAGKRALVEVIVEQAPGQSARAAGDEALRAQGARRIGSAKLGSEGFGVTGLEWPNGEATQHYNSTGQPFDARGVFVDSQDVWTDVTTSFFDFDDGGNTTTCPSLARECPGPQFADEENGVGWASLSPRTLAVTWWLTSTPEADMLVNTRVPWSTDCPGAGVADGRYDLQSVVAHEDGHVAGLDHSDDPSAIMFATLAENQAQCTLGTDDEEGLTYLYPEVTGTVTGTITDGTDPIGGATVSLAGTDRTATTLGNGSYTITDVPYAVTYDVVARAPGFLADTTRQRIETGSSTVNFTLEPDPFCQRRPSHRRCS